MQAFCPTVQTLGMEHPIHFDGGDLLSRLLCPAGPKPFRRLAPAEEAGTMASGKRHGLIEKEEFRPAPPAHHRAPTPETEAALAAVLTEARSRGIRGAEPAMIAALQRPP